jgi:hypothetical protein
MSADHPMAPFVPVLKDLAEGRFEREPWLAWWAEHAEAIAKACPPEWCDRLTPRQIYDLPSDVLLTSQGGAVFVLKQLNIPHEPTKRYGEQRIAEFNALVKEGERKAKEKAKQLAPLIAPIAAQFPKFGAFLKRRAKDLVEEIKPPISDEQLAALTHEAGGTLPGAFVRLLRCSAGVWVGALDLRTHHVFYHTAESGIASPSTGMLCFGEFWLEADGDQVLFDPATLGDDDPPVYYYAHAVPEVRQLSPRFSEWLEALPRSSAFRS